jgi:hypothetical protein
LANHSFKKFLAAGTSAAVVVSVVAPAASAESLHPFEDVSKNYDEAVGTLYEWGIVNGKSDTMFGTNLNLTRGDAAVIMANALGLDTEEAPDAGFTDLIPRIEGSVNALAEAGIISGVSKDKFAPNLPLTRGAMAKILVLGFELGDFAMETPFNDAVGAFGPYIEALYGTEITFGKTKDSFGTNLNITRGDFANLLYRTFIFIDENIYLPYAESAEIVDYNTLKVTIEEAAPEEYTAQDIAEGLMIGFEAKDGSMTIPGLLNAELSADRKTVTFDISPSLEGKEGTLWIDDLELAVDFAAPVAGKGSITLAGTTTPVAFDFAGKTIANVELTGTNGVANLDGMKMSVVDKYSTAPANIIVTLDSTTVEAAKAGEGKTWGQLQYKNGSWELVNDAVYDNIPAGSYVLKAPFTDAAKNTTTLTLNVTVK